MNKLAREPLLHFLLLGAAIFVGYGLLTRGTGEERGKIVVTQGQLESMTQTFIRTRQRPPTQDEFEGLVRARVQEEVYYREALAQGLDKDDVIIRRRLQQKMAFVSEGLAAPSEPSDAELQTYLQAHTAEFAAERRFSLRQVYLDPQRHGANMARDTARVLAGLNATGADANLARLGDPTMLEHEYRDATAREVASTFGDKFTTALDGIALRKWQGPVESGYGMHLVFVAERTEGGTPELADVRDAVRREWIDARQREAADNTYRALLRKYAVTIETPRTPEGSATPVAAR